VARKSLLGKAKDRPQQARQAIELAKDQGPLRAYQIVMGKLEAIEQVDKLMVPQVLAAALTTTAPATAQEAGSGGVGTAGISPGGLRVLVLPDHPTPLEIKTHVAEPVPFVLWGPGFAPNGAAAYTEDEARATGLAVAPGHLLMSTFLG
jgi:hypothetical protein